MKTYLIMSDLHISEATKTLTEKLFDQILKEDFDTLIHLGDLFEQKDRIPNHLQKLVVDFVTELMNRNKEFITLFGNHDGFVKEFPNALYLNHFGESCRLVTDPTVIDNFAFIPYSNDTVQVESWIRDLAGKVDYCCIHNDIKQLIPDKKGVDVFLLKKSFKYVFAGHIHFPRVYHKVIYIVGNPYARNFTDQSFWNERVERGYLLFYPDKDEIVFRKFESVYYVKLTDQKQLDRFKEIYSGKKVHLWLDFPDSDKVNDFGDVIVLSKIATVPVSESDQEDTSITVEVDNFISYLKKQSKKKPEYWSICSEILKHFGVSV